jgi:phosphatidylethanolamine-binding protein (PEBP) family uncharacterized protein
MRVIRLLAPLLLLTACGPGSSPAAAPSVAPSAAASLTVSSDAFAEGASIPTKYTCKGEGTAPTIRWSGDLHGARAVAVVVDDPDAPRGTFVHRVVLDLPATATSLGPDARPAPIRPRTPAAARDGPRRARRPARTITDSACTG